MIMSESVLSGQAITNPACLRDCFSSESGPFNCLASLVEDVATKGTCDDGNNPAASLNIWGWSELENDCILEEKEYYDYYGGSGSGDFYYDYPATMIITAGTCSDSTETALQTDECMTLLAEQPKIIKNTLELLIQYSCTEDVFSSLTFSQARRRSVPIRSLETAIQRLPPLSEVVLDAGTKTELSFENTRHRYPWICSLRTKDLNPEHLCAVNLLAIPPNPTVIVGAAHCTYICKDTETDSDGMRALPPCCCVASDQGQESCSFDAVKCGTAPRAVEMDGRDAEILCGEWQTGAYGQNTSGEEYNVVLPIEEIIRSPNFDAETLGPGGALTLLCSR